VTVDMIFQATDLVNRRVEFLDAARRGLARLRDKDGTSLVMLPERRLDLLQALRTWSIACLRLEQLIAVRKRPSVKDLGDLAWLRVFDTDELRKFAAELHDALLAANSDDDAAPLFAVLDDWRARARLCDDPLRREMLLSGATMADLVDAASQS
jgi:hypothetical protein